MVVPKARPIIAAGGEPLNKIMAVTAALNDGEKLTILAPFEPVPLEAILSSQDFNHAAEKIENGNRQAVFRRRP